MNLIASIAAIFLQLLLINGTESAVQLTKIELYTQYNAENHRTSYYELVADNGDLVLRRGQSFYLAFSLNQPFDLSKQQFWLQFVFGSKPKAEDKSLGNLLLKRNPSFMKQVTDWDIDMYSDNGTVLSCQAFVPATVPVGQWKLRLIIIENGARKTYEIKNNVYILFNPWVKEDDTYNPDEDALEEYVLSDIGKVYLGTAASREAKEWLYGQYKATVLPAIMFLLNKAPLEPEHRANAMQLSSVLSALINSNDDNGLISGKWSEPYKPYKAPWEWMGSAAILEEYHKSNGQPVRYGQCWVFAAVFTTVCRALGIPARPVTNYRSAHDTNQNLIIENYYDNNGAPISGLTGDSIWNFHVWTEAWMWRTDLPQYYSGWQAVDATPQELSDGFFRTGPAPVNAIKDGSVRYLFDCPFVFAEVSADLVNFYKDPKTGKFIRANPITDYVGKLVFTKRRGVLNNDIMHPSNDEDVTLNYKFAEGTWNERDAFYNASKQIGIDTPTPRQWFTRNVEATSDVQFKCETHNETLMGQPFSVVFEITNSATAERTVEVFLNVTSTYYTAKQGKAITLIKKTIKVPGGQSKLFEYVVKPEDYVPKLVELSLLKITTFFKVTETNTLLYDVRSFKINHPPLTVTVGKYIVIDDPFELQIQFNNPLSIKLTQCRLTFEAKTFGPLTVQISDIKPKSVMSHAQTIELQRPGIEFFIVNLACKELSNVLGKLDVNVAYD